MKKNKISTLCLSMFFVFFVFTTNAFAKIPTSLELRDLIMELLATHERVQAAQAAVRAAECLVEQAEAAWAPQVNVSASVGNEGIIKSVDGEPDTWKNRNQQSVNVTQKVLDFGATDGNIKMYQCMVQEAQFRLEQTKQELMTRGVHSYLSLVKSREMLKYAKRSEENIKNLSGMQEALVQRGAGLSYEELQIKAQLAGAQALVVNAERSLQTAVNSFRSLFGMELMQTQLMRLNTPKTPIAILPSSIEECIEIAREENPFLLELMAAVNRNVGQVDVADAKFYPNFNLVGEYLRKEKDQGAEGARWELRGGAEFNYNIYNGGGDSAALRSARSGLTASRLSVQDRARTVEESVRNAWLDLKTLYSNVELYENQANITWEFLSLVKKKKAMGAEVGLLDILVGERDYINAMSAKVGAELDYNIAAYTLLFQMGRMGIEIIEG